jgi:hypothetical protein
LLHPNLNWGSNTTSVNTTLSPNRSVKSVDQLNFELQQLTHWWSVVDQLVDELHGEGMRLQEQLEEQAHRRELLEGLLKGLGDLGEGRNSKSNTTTAR